jgi:lipoyl(octanoyl) transferase
MSGSCRAESQRLIEQRLGTVEYTAALAQQRAHAAARVAGDGPDVLMLLEHPSVYTAGRRTRPAERPTDGTPVVDVDRGGKITWHGPGQLVGYPIVRLSDPIDVIDYVRRLEEALITVCGVLGVHGGRVPGRTGVWLPPSSGRPERKIAAIGVRVQRGVTLHGFALNCDADLIAFDRIVPCGIEDAGVTSLTAELGRRVLVDDVLDATASAVTAALDGLLPVLDHPVPRARTELSLPGLTVELHPARS